MSTLSIRCAPDIDFSTLMVPPVGPNEGAADLSLQYSGDGEAIVAWQLILSTLSAESSATALRELLPDSPDAVDTVEHLVQPNVPYTRVVQLPAGSYLANTLCVGGGMLQMLVGTPAGGSSAELPCDGRLQRIEVVVPKTNQTRITWTSPDQPSRLRAQFIPEPLGA